MYQCPRKNVWMLISLQIWGSHPECNGAMRHWGVDVVKRWGRKRCGKKNINKYKSSQRDRNPFETWKPILAQVPDCPNPYNQSTIYNLPSTIYKHTLHYRKGICQFESCVKILERNKTCHKQFCMTPCVGFVLHAVVLCLCRNVSCMQ